MFRKNSNNKKSTVTSSKIQTSAQIQIFFIIYVKWTLSNDKHSCLPPQGEWTIHAENKISSMHRRKVLVRRIWPCLHVCFFRSQCQTRCADCPPLGYHRTSWAWSQPLLVYTIKQSVDIPADLKCSHLGARGMPALGRVNCIGGRWCPQQYKRNTSNGSSGGHERQFSWSLPPVMRDGSAEIFFRSWETVQQKSSSGHERRFSRNLPPCFLQAAVKGSTIGWNVHSVITPVQHFFCPPQSCPHPHPHPQGALMEGFWKTAVTSDM